MSSNRSFGLLFFIVFFIIGLWPLKNGLELNYIFIGISIIFLILGLMNSKILTPLNKIWVKFGELLGRIIAPIVMALIYFFILTPISLIMRIFGKDFLNLKSSRRKQLLDQKRKKYWNYE